MRTAYPYARVVLSASEICCAIGYRLGQPVKHSPGATRPRSSSVAEDALMRCTRLISSRSRLGVRTLSG